MKTQTYSYEHEAMTTAFEVIVAGQEREYARQAAGAAFRELDRLEKVLSKYDEGSDVGQINLLAPGGSVRVGLETLECLEIATWAHHVSGGLFDPTLGTGFQWLEIDRAGFSVGWKKDGKGELDLGGIGKGYAIDKAAEILADWDVEEVIINGGTSTVLALGREWNLGVGGPWGEKAGFSEIKLKDQALSGSGTEIKGSHIINPKTGKPAKRHLAAWAVHPSAAHSDALSTAFMMMEQDLIVQLCRENPGVVAFVVKQDESLIKIGV
ncbi:FAD:protein FMN transferase [Pontiella desulfatans]|uniref:FAD:protein FMN transferase n=1 Tax=Pontiella desulfatans TaxID=2750659 RepID=A0A6C2UEU4_PONDE|nr:FAD:protein FMN transferase [Pontiella desulfatans]VGO17894.1 FAD:protein FMN transferase [Pontiella desulfatans]